MSFVKVQHFESPHAQSGGKEWGHGTTDSGIPFVYWKANKDSKYKVKIAPSSPVDKTEAKKTREGYQYQGEKLFHPELKELREISELNEVAKEKEETKTFIEKNDFVLMVMSSKLSVSVKNKLNLLFMDLASDLTLSSGGGFLSVGGITFTTSDSPAEVNTLYLGKLLSSVGTDNPLAAAIGMYLGVRCNLDIQLVSGDKEFTSSNPYDVGEFLLEKGVSQVQLENFGLLKVMPKHSDFVSSSTTQAIF